MEKNQKQDEKDEKNNGGVKPSGGVYSKIIENCDVYDLWKENEYKKEYV